MTRLNPDVVPSAPAPRPRGAGAPCAAGVLALGCQPGAPPAATGSPGARMTSPADAPSGAASNPEAEAFRRRAREELARPGAEDAPEARAWLAGLPPAHRRTVALAAASDAD